MHLHTQTRFCIHRERHAHAHTFAASQEVKTKLYSSVLLIGGGLSFPGSSTMLQSRLQLQLPTQLAGKEDTIEVFSNVRVGTAMSV